MTQFREEAGQMVVESGTDNPNRVWIDLITPGWGTSGYYSQEVLARDMPKIYPKGSHMYIDHPPEEQLAAGNIERSVTELAAVLTETAHWNDERGSVGAWADLFPDWAEPIKAKSQAIGVSILAGGEIEESAREIDGREGPIIHSLDEGFSVDFVTHAGRGGSIGESESKPTMKLLESARKQIQESNKPDIPPAERSATMDEAERLRQQLSEAQDRVRQLESEVNDLTSERDTVVSERDAAVERADRAEDAIQLAEAGRIVRETVDQIDGMPDKAKGRAVGAALREQLPVDGDGKLVKETLQERAKVAAEAEVKYLTEAGVGSGSGVSGLGSGVSLLGEAGTGGGSGDGVKAAKEQLSESLQRLGMSEDAAKVAAEGR